MLDFCIQARLVLDGSGGDFNLPINAAAEIAQEDYGNNIVNPPQISIVMKRKKYVYNNILKVLKIQVRELCLICMNPKWRTLLFYIIYYICMYV